MPRKKREAEILKLDKPFYSKWSALYLSFFSSRLYVDVIKRWDGFGAVYLFLVVLILSVPLSIRIMIDFNYFLQKEVIDVISHIPEFSIQNGKVVFDKPMPYEVKNKRNEVIGIIDTTGKVSSLDNSKYPHLSYLITQEKIYYRAPTYHFFSSPHASPLFGPLYQEKLNPSANEVFTGEEFVKFAHIQKLRIISMLIIYPLIVSIFYVMLAALFLFIGIIGQFVGKLILKSPMGFIQSCRLIIVSATPAMTMLFILFTFDLRFTGSSVLFMALVAIYFCFGAIFYRRDSQQMARV